MKAPRFSALILLPLLILSGCASPTAIDYDRTQTGRLQSYLCFVIDTREQRESYQDVALSPIVDRRIVRSLDTELKNKGFQNDCDTPDFRVTFNTFRKSKTEFNDLAVGPTPFRRHPYFGYAGYSHINIDQYEEGSLVIDIIDNESKQLVWRGSYTKRLGREAMGNAEVSKIVGKILEHFPPGNTPKPN